VDRAGRHPAERLFSLGCLVLALRRWITAGGLGGRAAGAAVPGSPEATVVLSE
jgi:hypothetical protein